MLVEPPVVTCSKWFHGCKLHRQFQLPAREGHQAWRTLPEKEQSNNTTAPASSFYRLSHHLTCLNCMPDIRSKSCLPRLCRLQLGVLHAYAMSGRLQSGAQDVQCDGCRAAVHQGLPEGQQHEAPQPDSMPTSPHTTTCLIC